MRLCSREKTLSPNPDCERLRIRSPRELTASFFWRLALHCQSRESLISRSKGLESLIEYLCVRARSPLFTTDFTVFRLRGIQRLSLISLTVFRLITIQRLRDCRAR